MALVNNFYGGTVNFEDTKLASFLQTLLDKRKGKPAYYVGATLCVNWDEDRILTFQVGEYEGEVGQLIAKLYLDNKTPKHAYWIWAQGILNS